MLRLRQRQKALDGQLDEGLPHPENVDKLFGILGRTQRPQAASDAAGHNDDMVVGFHNP